MDTFQRCSAMILNEKDEFGKGLEGKKKVLDVGHNNSFHGLR